MSRLLIKHAVGGRTFVDSDANRHIRFEWQAIDQGKTRITVHLPSEMEDEIGELLRWKHEWNVFIFEELDNGLQQKTWFYSGAGDLRYNEAGKALTIDSSRAIRYLPSDYLA